MASTHTPSQTINFLSGEVQAILAFVKVLAEKSENPTPLLSRFVELEQIRIAEAEWMPVGDELLQGFQFASNQIRKALGGSTATNDDPDKP